MGTCNPHLAVLTANQFAAAYRGFFHQTVNYLRASGSNAERAEEIAQAAWARGWECREQLRDVSAVQSWVCTIARNLRHMDFRKARTMQNLTETAATIQPDTRPLDRQQAIEQLRLEAQFIGPVGFRQEDLLICGQRVGGGRHVEAADLG
ncbi:MAG: RNA polymerase sigma factor, partial [Acidobacteriota bacterium]